MEQRGKLSTESREGFAEFDWTNLGEGQSASGYGDGAAKFGRGFQPFSDGDFHVRESFCISHAIGATAMQLGNFCNESTVVLAPIYDDLVFSR